MLLRLRFLALPLACVTAGFGCSGDDGSSDDGASTGDATDATDGTEAGTDEATDDGTGDAETTDGTGDTGDTETTGPDDEDHLFTFEEDVPGQQFVNGIAVAPDDAFFAVGVELDEADDKRARGVIKMYYEGDENPAWVDTLPSEVPCFQTCASMTDVTTDDNGQVYVSGYVQTSDATGGTNAWVQRYQPTSEVVWTATFSGPDADDDWFFDVGVDNATGEVVAVGFVEIAGLRDALVVKYDDAGNELWNISNDGASMASNDSASAVDIGPNGEIVVVGREDALTIDGASNLWIASYDADGNEQWSDRINGDNNEFDDGRGVSVDGDGNIAAVGYTTLAAPANEDMWVGVYDAGGTLQWSVTVDGPHGSACELTCDYASDVDWLPDGNLLVSGAAHSTSGDRGAWVAVLDGGDGSELWSRTIEGDDGLRDAATSVAFTSQGAVLAGGWLEREDNEENWWIGEWLPTLP